MKPGKRKLRTLGGIRFIREKCVPAYIAWRAASLGNRASLRA
jgi:hypothetical protein